MVTRRRDVSMNGGCCFKLFAVKAIFCSRSLSVKNTHGDYRCIIESEITSLSNICIDVTVNHVNCQQLLKKVDGLYGMCYEKGLCIFRI